MGSGVTLSRTERAELRAVLDLQRHAGLGDRGLAGLIAGAGSAREALQIKGIQLDMLDPGEGRSEIDAWMADGVLPLPMTSPRYPECLRSLSDPPPLIFLRGDVQQLANPAVAIVGSRKASGVGRRMAEALGRLLASTGTTVVSGLALGIDGAAHRGALAVGGPTIAVLGTGIDVPYPKSHRGLFQEIVSEGLLVTEFLPGAPALRHHFPKRNRIIAALAKAVVVVEAGEKSGALITVDHGLDLGREIFAVPGSVENHRARGSNGLLSDGAGVITHPEGFLEDLTALGILPEPRAFGAAGPPGRGPSVPIDLQEVFSVLSAEPAPVEDIARAAGVDTAEAMAALTSLEIGGWARACPGLRFQAPAHVRPTAPPRHRRSHGVGG